MAELDARSETKLRYYDWHTADLGTIGELENELTQAPNVLDLGCGTGWLAHQMIEAGAASVLGVDVDEGAIQKMNEAGTDRLKGVVARADSLPFESESFDLVVAKDIIGHIQNPSKTVAEIFRVLRPGGKVYVATPSPQSRNFWNDYTHIRPFTKKALRAILEDNGFEVETMYYTGNYPLVGRYMRKTRRRRLPQIVRVLAGAGVLRNNVHAMARKPE